MRRIEKLVIYYYSGTGNAANVCRWILEVAKDNGCEVELHNLANRKQGPIKPIEAHVLYGFIAPTHGFNMVPLMFHFMLGFPCAINNRVFIVNTRGGLKMGRFFLPGLSGMAQYLSALILMLKGYKIQGMYPVDLPSNWISLHPGLKSKVVASIYEHWHLRVSTFAGQLIEGKTNYRALFHLIQDLLISPIAFIYYLMGRFILAKSFVAGSACNKCGLCVKECSVKAIKWVDKRPFWTFRCESCMHCMNICPRRAIETAHGYFIGTLVLIKMAVLIGLFGKFGIDSFFEQLQPAWLSGLLSFLISALIYLLLMLVAYRILHGMMRFRWFERLVIFTSLTHFKFWRRYQAPNTF
ncbi:MAG: EFR1 family ferrodoxin [Salinivirgaceae bacterium]